MPHIGKNPFIGFEKGEGERYGTPIYLTKEELKQLYQAEFSDTPSLEVQRDIFVFQCNVGCRVGDMMRLTKRDVINGAIEYIPNKTIKESAKTVVVPLNSMARAIVEKYKGLPGDSLLPFVASQNYNYAIKDALKKAGITRLVTTLNQLTRKEEKRPSTRSPAATWPAAPSSATSISKSVTSVWFPHSPAIPTVPARSPAIAISTAK